MIIKVIYRKSGAENFRTLTLETENELLIGNLQDATTYNGVSSLLKQYKGHYQEVKSETPDHVINVSDALERHVRKMHKAFGKKLAYSA